ncbi:PD-(D/E)XK nuclease family protein [Agrobacterium pusense]|uniref:PD-(D/E)XK nuclease family protein n=1 Tax=Agrobacterium pusense TaxID=648995 RepID=UPI000D1ABB37|nr:PD-(D/E)XK nuclease family protein [Agrobacterium pusense]
MDNDTFLTLTHATERDVDLLLIEELQCSTEFVRWLVARVSNDAVERSSVAHSKRRIHNRREIDITLTIEGPTGQTVCLIENKLDTQEQPRQAESYREEASALVADGRATSVHTILICPRQYAAAAATFARKFDHVIAYEDVADFFSLRASQVSGELRARLLHRRSLMDQATTKARRGYEAVGLIDIDRFLEKYVGMLREEAITLEPGPSMLKSGRPGESRTMIFAPSALPKWPFLPQTRLVHQLREGNANINLYGWGNHFNEVAGEIAADLKNTGYRLIPTINKRVGGHSGLMIVGNTPVVDSLASFNDQREAIVEGAKVAARLRDWLWSNEATLRRWARLISAVEKGDGKA